MKKLIFIFMVLFLFIPTIITAQGIEKTTIKSCIEKNGIPISMEYFPEVQYHIWTREDNPNAFLKLKEKSYIEFLGYAPDSNRSLEWYGIEFGWRGIDMTKWTDRGLLLFYDKPLKDENKKIVARAYIAGYPPENSYQIWITNLYSSTDNNGKYEGYHLQEQEDGNICAFIVDEWDFWLAMSWE